MEYILDFLGNKDFIGFTSINTQQTLSQFWSFIIRRTAFLNYIKTQNSTIY